MNYSTYSVEFYKCKMDLATMNNGPHEKNPTVTLPSEHFGLSSVYTASFHLFKSYPLPLPDLCRLFSV